MCFSATASFSAAAVVGGIGVACLWQAAGRRDRRMLPFALLPVLFAAQQAVEGLLWLDLARPEAGPLRPVLVHAFLIYAEVFWPIYAPLTAFLIEPVVWRRRSILLCLAIGVVLAAYLLAMMIARPYAAAIADGHIAYRNYHQYPAWIEVPYVAATTISLLLSSRRAVQLLAIVILAGFAVAFATFHDVYISVWCFFAGVASILVYLEVRKTDRREGQRTE
jgi:hypothetical protein